MVVDVDEADFQARVIERSSEVPVVVDFWAEWCGPCRALSPALERAAASRTGQVDLAKVDVDRNQRLAQTFRVQGIPAVKAFRDGRVADEFTGAIAPAEVEAFFDRLVPSEAELEAARAIADGDEQALREALAADPRQLATAVALGRLLLARDEDEQALAVLAPFEHDFLAAALAARARLSLAGEGLEPAFSAWDAGDHADALERLQVAFAGAADPEVRTLVRQAMIGVFTDLGPDSSLAREHRRRLSAAL